MHFTNLHYEVKMLIGKESAHADTNADTTCLSPLLRLLKAPQENPPLLGCLKFPFNSSLTA